MGGQSQDEEEKQERQSEKSQDNSDFSELEFDRPPTPPLAAVNIFDAVQKDTGGENFDEGADSKWKCYQNIRRHKRKFWME